jgi:hypothetical protein
MSSWPKYVNASSASCGSVPARTNSTAAPRNPTPAMLASPASLAALGWCSSNVAERQVAPKHHTYASERPLPVAAPPSTRPILPKRASTIRFPSAPGASDLRASPCRPRPPERARRWGYGSTLTTSVEESSVLVLTTWPRAPSYLPVPPTTENVDLSLKPR